MCQCSIPHKLRKICSTTFAKSKCFIHLTLISKRIKIQEPAWSLLIDFFKAQILKKKLISMRLKLSELWHFKAVLIFMAKMVTLIKNRMNWFWWIWCTPTVSPVSHMQRMWKWFLLTNWTTATSHSTTEFVGSSHTTDGRAQDICVNNCPFLVSLIYFTHVVENLFQSA